MSELPPGWIDVNLGDVVRFNYGKGLPDRERSGSGFPVYGSNGIVGYHSTALVQRECLVVGRKGSVGEVHLSEGPCWPIDTTYFVDDFNGMSLRYLYYSLRWLRLDHLNRATAIPGLNREDAYAQPMALAPFAEQKRIADKLDALLARVDACRERLDRVPGILKRFRESVLAAATSGELTREWREERGIDDTWDELPLEEIIEGKPRNGYSPKAVQHATPVKSLTLTATTTGRFRGEHFKYIDEQIPADSHLWLRPGDVLIQRANTLEYVGVSAIFDGPESTFIYPDLMMKCRANKRVLPGFLHLVLSSQRVRKHFRDHATGTAGNMPKINQKTVMSAPAVVPSIEEQVQIVGRTTELLGMADALDRAHAATLAKVTKLTPSALAMAFRGGLVSQDPNDEPASALLAKAKSERANAAAEPSRRRPKTRGERPTMSNTDKDSIKAAILKLKTDRFSFDELRGQVSGDYESLKAALFELLEEPSPVVRQVFDNETKAMQLVRVRP